MALVLKKLFETPYFRITVVPDAETVELCGALKVVLILLSTLRRLLWSIYCLWVPTQHVTRLI